MIKVGKNNSHLPDHQLIIGDTGIFFGFLELLITFFGAIQRRCVIVDHGSKGKKTLSSIVSMHCLSIQSQLAMGPSCLLDIAKLDRKIGKLVRLLLSILNVDSIDLVHGFVRVMLDKSNVFIIQKEGVALSLVKGRCGQR